MSELTNSRLRQLFNELRDIVDDDTAYENMQYLLPPDPNTGQPYSQDQLWAWMRGADASDLESRLNYFGGDFVQTVRDRSGQYYSFRMELPGDHNILSLLTTQEGHEARLQTAVSIMRNRYGYAGGITLTNVKPLDRYNPVGKETVILGPDYMDGDEDLEYDE